MALPAIIGGMSRAAMTGGVSGGATGAMTGAATSGRAVAQLAQFQGAMGQVGNAASTAAHGVTNLASMLTGKLTDAMTFVIGMVDKAAAPIASLVRIANPAIADAFGRAMQDAYGVIGRMLIPVMKSFIGVARQIGNVMAALEPVFQPAVNAIAKLVSVVGEELVRSLRENAPLWEALADMVTRVAESAMVLVKVLGSVISVIRRVETAIAGLFGFTGESMDNRRSAVGAAAREARFVQPKAISDEAIKNSLMMGVGQNMEKKDIPGIYDKIKQIYEFMEKTWGHAENAASGAATAAEISAPGPRAGFDIGSRLGRFAMSRIR